MPICQECGLKTPRLQWTHFKYKCTGKYKTIREYRTAYPEAMLVDPLLAKKNRATLENMIAKYGKDQGTLKWNEYRSKQANSNSFEYKKEKHGWTREQYNKFNKSRAVTLENLIAKYGENQGTTKWIAYCNRQAYTNTEKYFVEKYGRNLGIKKYQALCYSKSHSIDSIQTRHNCTSEEAINIRKQYKTNQYISQLELQFSIELQDLLGENLEYSALSKQYCIYANNRPYFYDIVHKKRAIEFNGDYWHCNPRIYQSNYYHSQSAMLAEEIWTRDKDKQVALLTHRNIPTLEIWEKDYLDNKDTTLQKALEWLTQKDSI